MVLSTQFRRLMLVSFFNLLATTTFLFYMFIMPFQGEDLLQLQDVAPNFRQASKAELEPMMEQKYEYIPSELEQYFIDNLDNLGYNETNNPLTCNVWTDPKVTNPSIHAKLQAYIQSIENHTRAINRFEPIPDILKTIQETNSYDVCTTTRLEGERVDNFFSDLALSNTGMSGFVEPLLPPMRHHGICSDFRKNLMNMNYLVHDFEAMCHNLKPTSRRVLIDMGASLSFHGGQAQPIIWLIKLFEKFGFYFDHIYGFEITFTEPEKVYRELLPEEYMASYHWINVGIEHNEDSKLNPLKSILQKFNEDDLIIVKLDIDTPFIELPLTQQLLENKDGVYSKLIDQFYFEHHVHLGELKNNWRSKVNGTIKDSLELFHELRKEGIPAHFWP
eukprot:CAMPEP_0204620392 /NCGR_PEP_ID=MMETSP0717-20131115/6448_1 /ASSEMBLY_ACC=CAM_ASM_000666 /TAXON_ID=230516 /ORGANISM="Chaetoceros curvisetus" /LENGTH=388 /DNA_ID=CAMNT_0051634587 /DNA_START=40 /DNA_END=1206 /DNA_ORIENTATION=+